MIPNGTDSTIVVDWNDLYLRCKDYLSPNLLSLDRQQQKEERDDRWRENYRKSHLKSYVIGYKKCKNKEEFVNKWKYFNHVHKFCAE